MRSLIDSSLWIDFTRDRSSVALKQFIAPYILSDDAVLAEPVVFEVLRYASDAESRAIRLQFRTLPILDTPADLWESATRLGQACRKKGINAGSVDLLIATVAMHNKAQLVTFDNTFEKIGRVSGLDVVVLSRDAL